MQIEGDAFEIRPEDTTDPCPCHVFYEGQRMTMLPLETLEEASAFILGFESALRLDKV